MIHFHSSFAVVATIGRPDPSTWKENLADNDDQRMCQVTGVVHGEAVDRQGGDDPQKVDAKAVFRATVVKSIELAMPKLWECHPAQRTLGGESYLLVVIGNDRDRPALDDPFEWMAYRYDPASKLWRNTEPKKFQDVWPKVIGVFGSPNRKPHLHASSPSLN